MLTAYGVGSVEDVGFALHMLQYYLEACSTHGDITHSDRLRLFRLYNHIQRRYREAGDIAAARGQIRWVHANLAVYQLHILTWNVTGLCSS